MSKLVKLFIILFILYILFEIAFNFFSTGYETKYKIDDLIKSAADYADYTKRRVTFEYALISGVNDSDENALEFADRLKGKMVHINLIPVNDVSERDYIKSSEKQIKRFADILSKKHIEVTGRRELGSDINAACGQLRAGYIKEK